MKTMISAVILTKNAQASIKSCMRSLGFADERIVIDDHSSDKTAALSKKLGAQVYKRDLAGDFGAARNFGLHKAQYDWVLFVDADEQVSKELALEIKSKLASQSQACRGYSLKRQDIFLGQRLKFGETGSVRLVRLARKGSGFWQGKVHEVWRISGKTATLEQPLIHQRAISLSRFMERLSWYASLRARELYELGVRESWLRLLTNPMGKFFQNYLWRRGFLDGFPGLAVAWFMSWHSLLVRIWLRLLWGNHGRETFKPNSKIWQ